jgi:arsenate reductase (thioredoxin)
MAAGFLRHLAGDAVEVRSAGSAPADQINPVAVQAMRDVGIDITHQKPGTLAVADSEASSVVITMGCGDVCPTSPAGATRTGNSMIPRAKTSTPSASFATRSANASKPWPVNCCRPDSGMGAAFPSILMPDQPVSVGGFAR